MSEQIENPPAFPNTYEDRTVTGVRHTHVIDGMALRDYFAARALPHVLSTSFDVYTEVAQQAYQIADAMLAARAKGGSQ